MTYLTKHIPRSVKETVDAASEDRVLTVVKNSMANYIDCFLNTTGVQRGIVEELGSTSLQYITDKSLPRDRLGNTDSNVRQVQLAKLTEDLTQKVPAVLIADGGFEWESSGLNFKDGLRYDQGSEVHQFAFIFKIPLTIVVLTNDEASCKDLSILLSLMFGPLQNIAGGSRIVSEDPAASWVITFPLQLTSPSFDKHTVEGDSLDHIWSGGIPIEIRYESKLELKIEPNKITSTTGVNSKPTLKEDPVINFTGPLIVGDTIDIPINKMEPGDTALIDSTNFSVAWERLNPAKLRVTGTKPGTFTITVLDKAAGVKITNEYSVALA